ncbi:hypothetical protein [Streptomyces sp. NPDC003077]|uniref:hypothetical protein n=1 Tax=Streptomyces sp. NPDC003077 TaxID=3154443 RepID=UPI0033A95881
MATVRTSPSPMPPLAPTPAGPDGDEYTVLWQAVSNQVITRPTGRRKLTPNHLSRARSNWRSSKSFPTR